MWSPAFKRLFSARVLCVFADSLLFFALLKELELRVDSSFSFTWFYVAYYAPVVLLGMPIGTWVGTKVLHHVIQVSNVARAFLLIVAFLFLPQMPLVSVFLLLILLSVLDLFFLPASQTLLPRLVEDVHRPKANSLFQLVLTGSRILAQITSGVILSLGASPTSLLIICVVLFLVSAVTMKQIPHVLQAETASKRSIVDQMKAGFQFAWSHNKLRMLFIFIAIGMFAAHSFELILLTFLTDTLKIGVENMAWIGSANIFGIMIGAGFAPKLMALMNRKWLLLPPFFFIAITFVALFFADTLFFLLPFFSLQGIAIGLFQVTTVSLIQEWTTTDFQPRIFTLYLLLTNGMILPSILLSGLLLSTLTVEITVLLIASILVIAGLVGVILFPALGKTKEREDELTTRLTRSAQ